MYLNYRESKLKLVKVFQDTLQMCETNEVLKESLIFSIQNQKIYPEEEMLECEQARFEDKVKISVSTKRTFQAAKAYANRGEKTCVLNFANSVHVGGGVAHGARAQEEALCRTSTLYPALSEPKAKKDFYEKHQRHNNFLGTDDIIYTPSVVVFKTDTDQPETMPQEQWFQCDVITCAAPCLYDFEVPPSEQELYKLHTSRWQKILLSACKNDVTALVLGAFGCGAFRNPPEIVAQACFDVLKDFSHAFKFVEFAVFCTPNKMENFYSFQKVMAP